MKKNFAMRIAACLLVVTMLSLCMVSYTYAKYTTGADGKAEARVAKWGVTVSAKVSDLFESSYINGPESDSSAQATVKAGGNYNMLAPGVTDNQAAAIAIKGQPEVAVNVQYSLDIELTDWKLSDTEDYMPLVIEVTIGDRTSSATYTFQMAATESNLGNVVNCTSVDKLCKAIEDLVEGLSDEFVEPNTDLTKTINIKWTWAFEGADGTYQTDAKDTALGDLTKAPKFSISLGATVEQVN